MTSIFNKEKDYEISSIDIIKNVGGEYKRIDFFPNFVNASIYQDIFNSAMSGNITFTDTTDIPYTLPLTGEEFVEIGITYPDTSLANTVTDSFDINDYTDVLLKNIDNVVSNISNNINTLINSSFLSSFFTNILSGGFDNISNFFSNFVGFDFRRKKTLYMLFRAYKLENIVREKNKSQMYTLHLCAPEYIWNLKSKINKNYQQTQISSIVSSFFTYTKDFYEDKNNELFKNKVKQDALLIEETLGLCNYSSINANPFTMINDLASRAISKTDESSNFVFYQNNAGFNFRSLSSIFKQNNTLQFFYRNPNLNVDKQANLKYDAFNFEMFNQLASFDVLNNLRQGLYGSQLQTVDIIRQTWKKYDYNIKDSFDKYNHTDENAQLPFSDLHDALNSPAAKLFLTHSTKDHDIIPHLRANDPFMADEKIENYIQTRAGQMRQIQQNRVYARLPGHPTINAGLKARFDMPDSFGNVEENPQKPNKYLQGNYVITAVAHHLNLNNYMCEVELIKDSFANPINYRER